MVVDKGRLAAMARTVPRVLWKYCGTQALPMLETMRLKATRPNAFNDPFEFGPAAYGKVTVADLERLYRDPAWVRHWSPPPLPDDPAERLAGLTVGAAMMTDLAREIMQDELDRASRTYAVICLAADPASILMWSHYADYHRGFAVGIDHAKLGRAPLYPVTYATQRVRFRATTPLEVQPDVRGVDVFLRKAAQWAYEQEFRSIWPLKELIPGQIGTGEAHFLPLLPEAIAEVRLGCRVTPELEQRIVDLLRASGSKAKVSRATLHPRRYRLVFERVGDYRLSCAFARSIVSVRR